MESHQNTVRIDYSEVRFNLMPGGYEMADRVVPGPVEGAAAVREAVCIHTRKIFDSCKDKDCVEDLRVYPTVSAQESIDNAFSVRARSAELLYADVRVKEITFNKGFYTVDVTYFYRVKGETFPAGETVTGLAIFDKRVMLFGSEASAKTFSSDDGGSVPEDAGLPIGVVESVDPIALHMKLVDNACVVATEAEQRAIPEAILDAIGEDLVLGDRERRLYVTIGQFSIIRLERDTQLLIPAYDYCMPDKACEGATEDDPCTMFSRIRFPVDEFFPPDTIPCTDDYRSMLE